MTTLTASTVLIILYGILSRHGYGRALALGGATAAGSAFVAGSTAVPTFYAVALGTAVALGAQFLVARRDGPERGLAPGVSLLLVFLAWSVLVTLVSPLLFDGLATPLPTGPGRLVAGGVTASNLAQIIYLVLGVCVVAFVARSRTAGPGLIGLVAGTTTLLSLWRTVHELTGLPFPEGVFDNAPFFAYIETAPGGVQRFRGIMSEPSGLAGSSLVTLAYMLPRAGWLQGWRRIGALAVAAAALYLGVISTSTTFVVAGVALAVIAAVIFAGGFLLRRTSLSAGVWVVGCLLVIVALWVLPIVADFVGTSVGEKVSSASFDERSGADAQSYGILFQTAGIGVGLGAARASSFLPGLLGTTGLVGTLLFAAVVVALVRRGSAVPHYRPVVWALVAALVLKVTAGPDLSDSSGIMWLSLGLLSQAALMAARGPDGNDRPPGAPDRPPPPDVPGDGPAAEDLHTAPVPLVERLPSPRRRGWRSDPVRQPVPERRPSPHRRPRPSPHPRGPS